MEPVGASRKLQVTFLQVRDQAQSLSKAQAKYDAWWIRHGGDVSSL